jgi:hypothetical protein
MTELVAESGIASIRLNSALIFCGVGELLSLAVGEAEALDDSDGDCDVDGFWSVPQFGYSSAHPVSEIATAVAAMIAEIDRDLVVMFTP